MTDDDGEARAWFSRYKRNEVARGRTPLGWGAWINAGMPTPVDEGTGEDA